MNPYYRPTALDNLPSAVNRLVICSEYSWRDYHYILHSCYAQPDTSYWFQAAFELWRNTAMLVILTTAVLSAFVGLTLAANGIVWLITQGVKRAYNAVTAVTAASAAASATPVPQHKILKNKSQST
jgi:hypothetical protein